ncbi:MAG: hypothetical protein V4773_26640, partial [Verrucomicrobiota bacterium]
MSDSPPGFRTIIAESFRLAALHRALSIPSSYAVDRRLEPHYDAQEADLVEVGLNDEGRPIRLVTAAAAAWYQMRDAAA